MYLDNLRIDIQVGCIIYLYSILMYCLFVVFSMFKFNISSSF